MQYLDLQVNLPLFIKSKHHEITWQGKHFKQGQHIPWVEMGVPYETARSWFALGMTYHDDRLEKQTQVGDRLIELDKAKLDKLVDSINVIIKGKSNSTDEFNKKKCKKSRIEDKQRGLLRSFLRNNSWIEENFFTLRDNLLDD